MLPLRYAKRWQLASLILLLLVLAATLMPAIWLFDNKLQAWTWFQGIDKWAHGIAFLILTLWFCGLYRRESYWRVAIGLLAFGLLIEVCQRMVSYRTAELFDVAADAVGIAAGLLVALAGIGGWSLQAEKYLDQRRSD